MTCWTRARLGASCALMWLVCENAGWPCGLRSALDVEPVRSEGVAGPAARSRCSRTAACAPQWRSCDSSARNVAARMHRSRLQAGVRECNPEGHVLAAQGESAWSVMQPHAVCARRRIHAQCCCTQSCQLKSTMSRHVAHPKASRRLRIGRWRSYYERQVHPVQKDVPLDTQQVAPERHSSCCASCSASRAAARLSVSCVASCFSAS